MAGGQQYYLTAALYADLFEILDTDERTAFAGYFEQVTIGGETYYRCTNYDGYLTWLNSIGIGTYGDYGDWTGWASNIFGTSGEGGGNM